MRMKSRTIVLLTVFGTCVYNTLLSILTPAAPRLDVLTETLNGHCDPRQLAIGQRFQFFRCPQWSSESIPDRIADLSRITITC